MISYARIADCYQPVEKRGCPQNTMFCTNPGIPKALDLEGRGNLLSRWPILEMSTTDISNSPLIARSQTRLLAKYDLPLKQVILRIARLEGAGPLAATPADLE